MRHFLIIFLYAVASFAIDYIEFEKIVIKNSPSIDAKRLEKSASKLKKRIKLRYDNPSIEGEISSFNINNEGHESGWRIEVSQSIRTFGFEEDLKKYANTITILAKKGYENSRSNFIAKLRQYYTKYVKAVRTKKILNEEIAIYKRLESITKARFENGADSRSKYMQASLQRIAAETKLIEIEREIVARYYDLISITGLSETILLDTKFIYPVKTVHIDDTDVKNAKLDTLEILKKQYEAEAKMQNRNFKTYRIFAAYEDDIDQSIVTFGVEIDLPLFNQNKEEYQLAKIKAQQANLKKLQLKNSQQKQLESFIHQIAILKKEYIALKKRALKEQELMALFEEGYRTAQSSLLDLIQTQYSLIDTKRRMLEIEYLVNLYHIQIDYLKGRLK